MRSIELTRRDGWNAGYGFMFALVARQFVEARWQWVVLLAMSLLWGVVYRRMH